MNDDRLYAENEISDEEFRMIMRMIPDSEMVHAGHLKDIAAWLREEGKRGRYMSDRGLVLFSTALLNWVLAESQTKTGRIVN